MFEKIAMKIMLGCSAAIAVILTGACGLRFSEDIRACVKSRKKEK